MRASQIRFPALHLRFRSDHEVARLARDLLFRTRSQSRHDRTIDIQHPAAQLLVEGGTFAELEDGLAESGHLVRRHAVGEIRRHPRAPLFISRPCPHSRERLRNRIVGERRIFRSVLQDVDHELHGLRQIGTAFRVIDDPSAPFIAAESVGVGETGGPGLHEHAVGSTTAVKPRGQEPQQRFVVELAIGRAVGRMEMDSGARAFVDQTDEGGVLGLTGSGALHHPRIDGTDRRVGLPVGRLRVELSDQSLDE